MMTTITMAQKLMSCADRIVVCCALSAAKFMLDLSGYKYIRNGSRAR
jgi:hypothetical protein